MSMRLLSAGLLVAATAALCVPSAARAQQPDGPGGVTQDKFKPKWEVGQSWVVETVSQQQQVRRDPPPGDKPQPQGQQQKPVQWEFKVEDVEKVGQQDCYKVKVQPKVEQQDQGQQPATTMWVNTQSMMLQKLQTQLPVQGGFRDVVETYSPGQAGQAAPVLSPLTVVPLEMPVFQEDKSKSIGKSATTTKFSYETTVGPTKNAGDVGFAFDVEQEMSTDVPNEAKGLLADEFGKGLEKKPMVQVTLKNQTRQVRQTWQQNLPWPVLSNNGTTQARLIKFNPAPKK